MPTYSYKCDACGHELDVVQRMSEDALRDCPACMAPSLVRQVQAVGFALKGSGWYVTDFRDKGKANKSGDAAPAKTDDKPAAAEAKSETKTESKSETKTEAPKAATGTGD